ncbi:MAG: hypothetical protein GY760_05390 [Deltaproteobacteria bacterium]|nr:hypothetical protein [Deltaproteobacteria bacterium]
MKNLNKKKHGKHSENVHLLRIRMAEHTWEPLIIRILDKIQGISKNNEPILLQFFLEITKYFAKRTVIRDSHLLKGYCAIKTGKKKEA